MSMSALGRTDDPGRRNGRGVNLDILEGIAPRLSANRFGRGYFVTTICPFIPG